MTEEERIAKYGRPQAGDEWVVPAIMHPGGNYPSGCLACRFAFPELRRWQARFRRRDRAARK